MDTLSTPFGGLSADVFRQAIGEAFAVPLPDREPLELVLAEVRDLRTSHTDGFSLLFHGPLSPQLRQGTGLFTHPELGEQILFLVPIQDSRRDCTTYEVLFNRMLTPAELAVDEAAGARPGRK